LYAGRVAKGRKAETAAASAPAEGGEAPAAS
jgi:hypothetical protein